MKCISYWSSIILLKVGPQEIMVYYQEYYFIHLCRIQVYLFFLSSSQSIRCCSASAECISGQYHFRQRDLQLCILAPTRDTGINATYYKFMKTMNTIIIILRFVNCIQRCLKVEGLHPKTKTLCGAHALERVRGNEITENPNRWAFWFCRWKGCFGKKHGARVGF